MEKINNLTFDTPSFGKRLKGMLSVDFYRLFHTPLFYIFIAIAAVIPAMIIGTTGMEGSQTGALPSGIPSSASGFIRVKRSLTSLKNLWTKSISTAQSFSFR